MTAGRVGRSCQATPGHVRALRVGQKGEAVGVGQPRGADVAVQSLGVIVLAGAQVAPGQQLQGHGAGDAARGERRHAHARAAVGHLQRRRVGARLPVERPVALQVGEVERASRVAHRVDQPAADLAAVERVGSRLADRGQRVAQVRMTDLDRLRAQQVAARVAPAGYLDAGRQLARRQEHPAQLRVARELSHLPREGHQVMELGGESVLGELHGRRHHRVERQAPERGVRGREAGHRAGRGDGARALQVGVILHARPAERAHRRRAGEAVHVRRGGQGGAHGKGEHAAPFAHLVDEVSAAADAAGGRLHDPHRERGRHGRVHDVAAGAQRAQGGGAGQPVLGRHHGALPARLALARGEYALTHHRYAHPRPPSSAV